MPRSFPCPECGTQLKMARPEETASKVRCPCCDAVFVPAALETGIRPGRPAESPSADRSITGAKPERRGSRRRDLDVAYDDDNDLDDSRWLAPHRRKPSDRTGLGGFIWLGVTILGLALLSFVGGTETGWRMVFYLGGMLLIAPCLFLSLYLIVPLVVLRKHRPAAEPSLERFSPEHAILPVEVWTTLRKTKAELEPEGFRVWAHFCVAEQIPGFTMFVTLFNHPKDTTIGKLAEIFPKSKKVRRPPSTLTFVTEFANGTDIVTANNTVLGTSSQQRRGAWLPEVQDGWRLYAIHAALIAKLGEESPRRLPVEDPALYLRDSLKKEVRKFTESGYHRLDHTGTSPTSAVAPLKYEEPPCF